VRERDKRGHGHGKTGTGKGTLTWTPLSQNLVFLQVSIFFIFRQQQQYVEASSHYKKFTGRKNLASLPCNAPLAYILPLHFPSCLILSFCFFQIIRSFLFHLLNFNTSDPCYLVTIIAIIPLFQTVPD
jgi:hypothetical protein